jgi:CubicO group peptidase (beta-lactamase class C family)
MTTPRLTRVTLLSLVAALAAIGLVGAGDSSRPAGARPSVQEVFGRSALGPSYGPLLGPSQPVPDRAYASASTSTTSTTSTTSPSTAEDSLRPPAEAEIDAWIESVLGEQEPADPLAAVDACVKAEMDQTKTPGASIAIIKDGEILLAKGYGVKAFGDEDVIDHRTMFRIGSTTKMMVAAGILQQVEAGNLDLRESITTYLPELDLDEPWDPETITLHHLMTHSAGLPDRINPADMQPPPIDPNELADWATTLGDWPLFAPPGSFWNYSNPGWSLAGLILEGAAGEPYRDYVKQKVWEPAGMPLTSFDPNDVMEHGNYSFGHEIDPATGGPRIDPATGLPVAYAPNSYDSGKHGPAGFAFSTPTEMVAWAELMMNGGASGGEQVLSRASADAMQAPQIDMDYTPDDQYGYGVFLSKYRGAALRDHGGNINGWSSQLIWVPEQAFAVSVLANTAQSLSGSAYCAVREVLKLPVTPPEDYSTDPFTWQKYAGTYDTRLSDGRMFTIWVTWKDDELEAVFEFPKDLSPVALRVPLVQAALDTFLVDFEMDGNPDLDITFIDDPGNPGPIKYLRNRAFVGTKGADRPVPTDMPTEVPTATDPTATATPRATAEPKPVYLPVTIKDIACTPVATYLDVAFVLDGSSYMETPRGASQAWEVARGNIRSMLGLMDFTPDARGQADRAAVIVYRNHNAPEPGEQMGLSGDKAAVERFVNGLVLGDPRDTSRIDTGLEYGRAALRQGRRTRPESKPVIVVLSELQAKNVPFGHIPECESRRNGNEECAVLKVADSIKAEGITIAVFATGTANRGGQMLPDMATDRVTLFFERPTTDQIRGVYQRLAPRTECPKKDFWPFTP